MAEREKPKAPVLPFTGEDENEWESELADWDAHLPITEVAPVSGAAPLPQPEPLGSLPEEENPFADTPITVTSGPPLATEAPPDNSGSIPLDDAAVLESLTDELPLAPAPEPPPVDDAAMVDAATDELPLPPTTEPPAVDDAAAFEASADEFSQRQTPLSDAYASIISTSTPESPSL